MQSKYEKPTFEKSGFNCPNCHFYAHQKWFHYVRAYRNTASSSYEHVKGLSVSICQKCNNYVLWKGRKIIYPDLKTAVPPIEGIPEDVKKDYEEARSIVHKSPRAAAALLRLGLQKLTIHLGEEGKNLNTDIANLIERGFPIKIQKALDVVRVIGNNAVHPGKIDMEDNEKLALSLFDIMNMIVEVMIVQPSKVDNLFESIPASTKKAIEDRSAKRKT